MVYKKSFMLVLFQVNLYIWASNNYIFIINTMKRRDFLTNTALLGAGIPLGMSSAVMTSCTRSEERRVGKECTS